MPRAFCRPVHGREGAERSGRAAERRSVRGVAGGHAKGALEESDLVDAGRCTVTACCSMPCCESMLARKLLSTRYGAS